MILIVVGTELHARSDESWSEGILLPQQLQGARNSRNHGGSLAYTYPTVPAWLLTYMILSTYVPGSNFSILILDITTSHTIHGPMNIWGKTPMYDCSIKDLKGVLLSCL